MERSRLAVRLFPNPQSPHEEPEKGREQTTNISNNELGYFYNIQKSK